MRKAMYWLFSMILFAALPAAAQHGSHGGGHASSGGHSQAHASAQPHNGGGAKVQNNHTQVNNHTTVNNQHTTVNERTTIIQQNRTVNNYHGGGYGGFRSGEARGYWRGGRFDHAYFGSHWGGYNRFYFGNCVWFGGPRWGIGSYFWFNGAYFSIVEPVPFGWYDDEVYVDDIDGVYYLVNPSYPGVYIRVGVRF